MLPAGRSTRVGAPVVAVAAYGALRLRLEEQRGVAVEDGRKRGGDVDLGYVVLAHVVGHDVAEEGDLPSSSRAVVIASSNLASRVTLTSSTVGSGISVSD